MRFKFKDKLFSFLSKNSKGSKLIAIKKKKTSLGLISENII